MRYVALLRGINVGGKNMIKMETLRATFATLGFENVGTYINSGNIVFDCGSPHPSKRLSPPDTELTAKIQDAIRQDFGFEISVMVRSMSEIEDIIKNNPFEGRFENDKDLHVFFLAQELTAAQENLLLENANENEMFAIRERAILCMLRISILDSVLGKGFIDRKLKIPATARNWRTVKKIYELF